jgi:hypothetical protein
MVTFSPVEVVSVNSEEDTLVIVPIDPPAAGPDLALEPLPDPDPPAGLLLLLAAGVAVAVVGALLAVPVVLLQAATEAITPAAAATAMTLLRLLENMCLIPVVEILDLRYRRPSRKCPGKSLEGGREVVQRGLNAKASARIAQVTPRPPGRTVPQRASSHSAASGNAPGQ